MLVYSETFVCLVVETAHYLLLNHVLCFSSVLDILPMYAVHICMLFGRVEPA